MTISCKILKGRQKRGKVFRWDLIGGCWHREAVEELHRNEVFYLIT